MSDETEPEKKETGKSEVTAAQVHEMWKKGAESVSNYRSVARLGYAFYRGYQWLRRSTVNAATIDRLPFDDIDRDNLKTLNLIHPIISTKVGMLMSSDLVPQVPPNAADDFSLQGAQVAETVIQDKARQDEWGVGIREQLALDLLISGTTAICIDWDSEAHKYSDDLATGDSYTKVLTLSDFCLEPGISDWKRSRYWIKREVVSPEFAKSTYNLEKLPDADHKASEGYTTGATSYFPGLLPKEEGVCVYTYYERPCSSNPEGCVAVVIDDKIVYKNIWPFPFKHKLNIHILRDMPIPGTWVGETSLTQALPIQVEINKRLTKICETADALATPKWVITDPLGQIEKQLNDDPRKPIKLPMNGSAKIESPPPLSIEISNQLESLIDKLQRVMNINDISMGAAPKNLESGYAVSLLASQDALPTNKVAKEIELTFDDIGTMTLELYQAKVKDPRKAGRASKYDPANPLTWRGRDFAGQVNVVIPSGSLQPVNKAQAMQLAQYAVDRGFATTYAQFTKLAQIPRVEDDLWAVNPDLMKARWVCGRLMEGEIHLPEPFDDAAVFINELHNFMKTPRWIMATKETQQLFRLLVEAYKKQAQEQAGERMRDEFMMGQPMPPTGPQQITQQHPQGV